MKLRSNCIEIDIWTIKKLSLLSLAFVPNDFNWFFFEGQKIHFLTQMKLPFDQFIFIVSRGHFVFLNAKLL